MFISWRLLFQLHVLTPQEEQLCSRRASQSQTRVTGTEVFYGAGASANAAKIATDFGTTAKALASLPAQHVEVLLGTGSTVVPAALTPTSSPSSSPSPPSSSAADNGAAGGAVTVAANAKYGIPCVF